MFGPLFILICAFHLKLRNVTLPNMSIPLLVIGETFPWIITNIKSSKKVVGRMKGAVAQLVRAPV